MSLALSAPRLRLRPAGHAVLFLTGLFISLSLAAEVNPARPRIPDRNFQPAVAATAAEASADETASIQAALDEARQAGGGRVVIPAGTHLSGPLQLHSNIELQLSAGAILRMLPLDRYPGGSRSPENFLSGSGLHDVAITGKGTIDGQGAAWWPSYKVKGFNRPRMIALNGCERVLIEGVTLMNSPMFHIAIGGASTDVIVSGVTIRAPSSRDRENPSHNTDACDVSGRNILIRDCDVSVGDDNFTCGGGTSDVLITDCRYGNGHGVSVGSHTRGGVSNITVRRCSFTDTECGIRLKTDRDRGGHVHHLVYEDLRMSNVDFPILVYGAYMAQDRRYRDLTNLDAATALSYPTAPVDRLTPLFSDIVFRNITATVAPGRRAGLIWGLPESKAERILLQNLRIRADKPFGIFSARGIRVENCEIQTPGGLNRFATGDAELSISP